ncbi:MAG TPA: ribosome maturation factor RimM [Marmoricola sp.]|nr:ribosome maturation factor RimM [Marmoricola sp.]
MDDYVVVGRIGRPHGVHGEVSVEPLTDEPDRRFADGAVLDVRAARPAPAGTPATLTVTGTRWHQGRLLVRFAELGDRTAAEAARGCQLSVAFDPEETPEDPDEFYDHQLVGLGVEDTAGHRLGAVVAVEHTGAQDLLRIDVDGLEVLFPFVTALVPVVDVAGGRVVVDDRPGLLGGAGS